MKSSSKALLGLAGLLALVIAGFLLHHQAPEPDQTQIAQQLEAARAAGERHNTGALMRIISEKYQDSNISNPIQLRAFLHQWEGNTPIQVSQSIPVVSVQGDTATSTSHLRVVTSADNRVVYDHDITLHWQREDGTRLLVIPTKVWRVISAEYGGPIGP